MLARSITYTNPFTDKEVTETHHFHISKADLVEMELEEHNNEYAKDGETLTGMRAKLQRIIDSQDGKAILAEMKDMIRRSYGVRDGDRFIKNDENWQNFSSSEAFSQLLFELCTKPDAAAEFMNGVVPNNLEQIAAEVQEQAQSIAAGREAQAQAKAAGAESAAAAAPTEGSTPAPEPAVPSPSARDNLPETDRAREIANATAENPVTLTEAEVHDLDSDDLKSGIATGRYKLS